MFLEKSGRVGGSEGEEGGMMEPLLEVDEFEIVDKERWRCNDGGVWSLGA
jgi:hypothetical protein